jgi:methylated-DNA-[protein]-cysteine S-methyltransferase
MAAVVATRVVHHRLTDLTVRAALLNGRPVIVSVAFGRHAGDALTAPPVLRRALSRWCTTLAKFLDGRVRDLRDLPIPLRDRTPFQQAVLRAARGVRWGSTVSYAGLAARSGHPDAVRAAASVMRNNPYPLIVPCHRVVRSGGGIGGFMGKRGGRAIGLKRRLLEREGVRLS